MTEPSSMWGKLPVDVKMRTPVSFLKEQATALTKETKGLLQGQVVVQNSAPPSLVASLDIVAPALNSYRVRVVTISHGLTFYPVILRNEQGGKNFQAPDEVNFQTTLRSILSSAQVHNILGALMAQINASDQPAST